jgi:hypothetical protein
LLTVSLSIPTKVTSHLSVEAIGSQISLPQFYLNGLADALADKAVEKFEYPSDISQAVESNARLACLVSIWLTVIEKESHDWALANNVTRVFPKFCMVYSQMRLPVSLAPGFATMDIGLSLKAL